MRRIPLVAGAAAALLVALAAPAKAQDWTPPSRHMPDMPALAELDGGWRGSLGVWLAGSGSAVDQLRAVGEGSGPRARLVRFLAGVRPAAVWTDRNGDGKADMIELFRGGARAYMLIDADYDGAANVLRVYDAGGSLAREVAL